MKYWQHDETGRVVEDDICPGSRWFEIPRSVVISKPGAAIEARRINLTTKEIEGLTVTPVVAN